MIGGGPIGCELAQAFARLGTSVTLIEVLPRLLERHEPEASALVAGALRRDGVRVLVATSVRSVTGAVGAATLSLSDGAGIVVEQVLVATGRLPRTSGLGLMAAGVRTDGWGFVMTDGHMRTTTPGIFAAGDVTGRPASTHAADEMGRVAAANALSRVPVRRFRDFAIPEVTYTDPEVARVGMTEGAAAAVPGARVAHLPLAEVDRAVVADRTDGYVTLIAGPRRGSQNLAGGRLLGATIVAPRAGEMIALPALAMASGMFPARLALTVQAYPTWSLAIRQAAAQFFEETGGRRARPPRAG